MIKKGKQIEKLTKSNLKQSFQSVEKAKRLMFDVIREFIWCQSTKTQQKEKITKIHVRT